MATGVPRFKKILIIIVFIFPGVFVAMILSEILLAVFLPQPTFGNLYKDANRCWKAEEAMLFSLRPNCSYTLKNEDFSQEIHTNAQGMRGTAVEVPKPENVERIVVTGDSFILGNGVSEENTITSYLQRFLKSREVFGSKNVEVVNAGYGGGFSPDAHLVYLRRMIEEQKFAPDLVVMSVFVGNDFADMDSNQWIGNLDFSSPKAVKSNKFTVTADGLLINQESELVGIYKHPILRNSHLAVFLSRNMGPVLEKLRVKLLRQKPYVPKSLDTTDTSFFGIAADDCIFGESCHRRFQHLFYDLVNVLKAGQAQVGRGNFLVLIIPADFQIYPGVSGKYSKSADGVLYATKNPDPQPQKRIREMLDKEGIDYLDLLPVFRQSAQQPMKYFPNDGHWNEQGSALAALQIGKWIEQHVKIN